MTEVPAWAAALGVILTAITGIVVGRWRRQTAHERIEVEGKRVDIDRLRVATDVLVEIVDDQRQQLERERVRWETDRERLLREKERAVLEGKEVKAELEAKLEECNKHIAELKELQRRLGGRT